MDDFLSRVKYLMFSFSLFGNEVQRGVEFRHLTSNASKIRRIVKIGSIYNVIAFYNLQMVKKIFFIAAFFLTIENSRTYHYELRTRVYVRSVLYEYVKFS